MTVKQLMELLADYDGEQEVRIGSNYGDRQKTMVYNPIHNLEEAALQDAKYFGHNTKTEMHEEDAADFEGQLTVILW